MGGKQLCFSDYEVTTAMKQTKREKFLSEMEAVVPWQALIYLIEPPYSKTSKKVGRPPYPLARMLHIHLLQQWYSLSDPTMEEALIEVPTMRRFASIELISDRIPDKTTILTFHHLLEKNALGEQIFRRSQPTSAQGACRCIIVPSLLLPRSPSPAPPRSKTGKGIQRCTRPRRGINGISE